MATQERTLFPQPQQVNWGNSGFTLNSDSLFIYNNSEAKKVAQYFSQFIQPVTGYNPKLINTDSINEQLNSPLNIIEFKLLVTSEPKDSYQLTVETNKVTLTANSASGLFYAAQTLRQLLPAEIENRMPINKTQWLIPSVNIIDAPRFKHRGMHLDVSRHFFDVTFVKRYIDWLAFHKLNYFQWHLTDDQGWRIDIQQFPKLTRIGGYREQTITGHTYDFQSLFDNKPHGGYYTQAQIKEVVAYAKSQHIEIIPEIDIPGHSTAILAAYPEYSCHQSSVKVEQRFGIFEEVLCPTEETFAMLAKVYKEVADLFPSKYIHIGGDEVIKKQWLESDFVQQLMKTQGLTSGEEVQSYFIKRVSKIITALDKTLIGWDEILEGGIAKDAVIMSWRGTDGGITASKAGHDVIMSPYQYTYFDAYQSKSINEPKAIHGFLPLKMVYDYDPVPENLAIEHQAHILGAQGALWTEYIKTPQHAEYMLFPRLSALAEVLWTQPENKNWPRYSTKITNIIERYQHMGLNPSSSAFNGTAQVTVKGSGKLNLVLNADISGQNIFYTRNGSAPTLNNDSTFLYQKPIEITKPIAIRFSTELTMKSIHSDDIRVDLAPHKALAKKISFAKPPKTGAERILDGVMAHQQYYNVEDFAVFYDEDLDAVIDFDKPTSFSQVQLGIDTGRHRQLHPPQSVEILSSNDGITWQSIATRVKTQIKGPLLTINFPEVNKQFIRVIAINSKNATDPQIPKLPLYIDEIAVY
ncbi:MAG: family 20 glycosylhydrolase [Colwellia sp.]|nr:family 20 glycosylhydrolase [Colwellia sp.]